MKRVPEYLAKLRSIKSADADLIRSRIDELLSKIEQAPKTMGWKMRAAIGTRKKWYQEVSEKAAQY